MKKLLVKLLGKGLIYLGQEGKTVRYGQRFVRGSGGLGCVLHADKQEAIEQRLEEENTILTWLLIDEEEVK